jgi:hypothetical protein
LAISVKFWQNTWRFLENQFIMIFTQDLGENLRFS